MRAFHEVTREFLIELIRDGRTPHSQIAEIAKRTGFPLPLQVLADETLEQIREIGAKRRGGKNSGALARRYGQVTKRRAEYVEQLRTIVNDLRSEGEPAITHAAVVNPLPTSFNPRWMNLTEIIEEGCSYDRAALLQIVHEESEAGRFETRRAKTLGRPYEVLVSAAVARRLGLSYSRLEGGNGASKTLPQVETAPKILEEKVVAPVAIPVKVRDRGGPRYGSVNESGGRNSGNGDGASRVAVGLLEIHADASVAVVETPAPMREKAPEKPRDEVYTVPGSGFVVSSSANYSLQRLTEILGKVRSPVINQFNAGKVANELAKGGRLVSGDELISFLREVGEAVNPCSTSGKRKIAGYLGIDEGEVESAVSYPQFVHCVRRLPGVPETVYFVRSGLEDYRREHPREIPGGNGDGAVREVAGPVADGIDRKVLPTVEPVGGGNGQIPKTEGETSITDVLSEWHHRLSVAHIDPRGFFYNRLIEAGVLEENSPKAAEESYRRYEDEMKGFEFFHAPTLREHCNQDWRTFNSTLRELRAAGLVKDLVSACGKSRGYAWVVKRGAMPEIYERLGLNYDEHKQRLPSIEGRRFNRAGSVHFRRS